MKLRLDRLDGIGRMACHSHLVVPAVCEGFFQGVSSVAPSYGLPEDFDATVREFIALHDIEQLRPMAASMLDNTSAEAGERNPLQHRLDRHLSAFVTAVRS